MVPDLNNKTVVHDGNWMWMHIIHTLWSTQYSPQRCPKAMTLNCTQSKVFPRLGQVLNFKSNMTYRVPIHRWVNTQFWTSSLCLKCDHMCYMCFVVGQDWSPRNRQDLSCQTRSPIHWLSVTTTGSIDLYSYVIALIHCSPLRNLSTYLWSPTWITKQLYTMEIGCECT